MQMRGVGSPTTRALRGTWIVVAHPYLYYAASESKGRFHDAINTRFSRAITFHSGLGDRFHGTSHLNYPLDRRVEKSATQIRPRHLKILEFASEELAFYSSTRS